MRRYEFWYEMQERKPGKRAPALQLAPYSLLARCDRCGRRSSANWVKRWYGRPYHKGSATDMEPTLCLSCVNQFKPLWKAEAEAVECRRLIAQIKREIASARRAFKHDG